MKQPLPEKTIFFESATPLSVEAGLQIQMLIAKRYPGWNAMFLDDGIRLSAVHGPAFPLEDWVDEVDARKLMDELKTHAECGEPADFPRLAMISIRQWLEQQNEKGGRKR